MSLKNIKSKILSVRKTSTVTRAMEAVSAVKMRKSQERALGSRAYAAAALSILRRLSGAVETKSHPLMQPAAGKTCVVLITSDKGLAGALNSGVIRKAESLLESLKENPDVRNQGEGLTTVHTKNRAAPERVVMLAIGRRGGDYFAARGYEVRAKYENVSDGVSEDDIREVSESVLAMRATGEIGSAFVVYQNFLSTFEQKPSVRQVLPVTPEMIAETVRAIRPARGKYAPASESLDERTPATYAVEPDADAVFSVLLPKLLNIAVFHALLEAKASEHSARMVAMKNATDKAKERAKELTRYFNKVRQAAITREVSEITSGIEAMR